MKAKFYEFTQNNSGGYFDVDDNVCNRVIIEAFDEKQAQKIFEPMIKNQSPSCPCCGDRWMIDYPNEIDLLKWKKTGYSVGVYHGIYANVEQRWFDLYSKFPRLEEPAWQIEPKRFKEFSGKIYFESIEQYCQFLADEYGWTTPDIRIHFLNGTKKEIYSKK